MSKPRYIIERWPLGWVYCSPLGESGIPMDALMDTKKLFTKNSVMDSGILHHLRASGKNEAVVCIATLTDSKKWRAMILDSISGLPAEERWWKGLDVGTSSAAIFAIFNEEFRREAEEFSRKSAPCDSADFGRCKRLLDLFPVWRNLLDAVAQAYPGTNWPAIIARWDEIEAATPEHQSEILRSL